MRTQDVRILGLVVTTFAALSLSGCTMLLCPGGGYVKHEELGDWVGVEPAPPPGPKDLKGLVDALSLVVDDPATDQFISIEEKGHPFASAFACKRRGDLIPFLPGGRHADILYYAPIPGNIQRFYVSEDQWGVGLFVGELLYHSGRLAAYDAATGRKVAASGIDFALTPLGWLRQRVVRPVGNLGHPIGLAAILDPAADPADARYELKDCHFLLFGVLGWGRVNRERYIQILFIPFPIGKAQTKPTGTSP